MEIVHHRCHHETGEADSTHLRAGSGTRRFLSRVSPASCDGSLSSSQTRRVHSFAASVRARTSMAERLARQQSAMKAWLQAEAESRTERAQKTSHTCCSTLALWNSCLLLESRRSEYGFSAHVSTRIHCTSGQTQKVHGWVARQFWLRKWAEAKSSVKKHMAQSGYKVVSFDAHLNTCDFSANAKVCQSTETTETWEKLERAQTLYRISFLEGYTR